MAAGMVSDNHTDSEIGCRRLPVLVKHTKVTIRPRQQSPKADQLKF